MGLNWFYFINLYFVWCVNKIRKRSSCYRLAHYKVSVRYPQKLLHPRRTLYVGIGFFDGGACKGTSIAPHLKHKPKEKPL